VKEPITPETRLDIEILEPLFHARENRIVDNEIYRVMLQLHDGNGIYLSGMGNRNIVARNYLHDIGGDRGYIRLDDHSAHTTIVNNVGVRCSMMFVRKGPAEYRNNFAIDCARLSNKRWSRTESDHCVYYNRKPRGARLKNRKKSNGKGMYVFDDFERWSNSLIYAVGSIDDVQPGQELVPPARRGGAEVGLLYADPMFDEAAMEQKIFRFRPGSPATRLGIKAIDLSSVGSTLAR
jgi:hypothetical protein